MIATTVFSWYNPNSWTIILLVLCRLIDGGPVRVIKNAFRNKYFVAFLIFVLIDAMGLLFTHNLAAGEGFVSKEASLVAIALVFCGGQFADAQDYRRLMTGYCLILTAACVYCLTRAVGHYQQLPGKEITVFFYHALSQPIGQNAVFFTVYMIFGLLFLLYHPLAMGLAPLWLRKSVQVILLVFFTGFIVLLSSKLLLVELLLILVTFVFQRYYSKKNYVMLTMIGMGGILIMAWIAISDNPVKKRYLDLEHGDISMIRQDTFNTNTVFNGAQIRLLQWRYANQIMREPHAWIFGVTSGTCQDLLNAKYREAHMFMGIPHTHRTGFTDYNFHNQYIETTVRTGIVGLAALLYICWLMIELAVRRGTAESGFTVLALLSICTVQSFLTMQHGVFAFAFMPLVLLSSPKRTPIPAPASVQSAA
ncbi:MAG TPA: O-antigen ligase family protein [Puia sp.]|nr:O-antigen ligase family protein [Puia sp.]